jgi:hypothetical protein
MKLIRIALLPFVVYMFVFPAVADYDYDGTPEFDLATVAHGTINGEVYVGGGHGVAGNPYQPNTYTQNFAVPDGTVTFARLYVGVWGGKEEYSGTLQTNFNGNDLGTLTLMGEFDSNATVWCTGHGVYWVYYNVTAKTNNGSNTATANTNKITSGFDGRMYGIVLVAVVENAKKTEIEYWINDGHWNLNYGTPFDSATTQFSGAITDPNNMSATLTTVYLTGDANDDDTLYFNGDLVIIDAADGCGSDEWGKSWCAGLDIDEWDLTNYEYSYLDALDNDATFDRGDDAYLHPVLAVLQVRPWYFKAPYQNPYRDGVPEGQPSGNYAPSGMPDFNQTQNTSWKNPTTGQWSFCGPTAVANSFWWFDSKFANPTGMPGDGLDSYGLISDYTDALVYPAVPPFPAPYPGSPWLNDDHRYDNVNNPATTPWIQPFPLSSASGELVERLAYYMDTDGSKSGGIHNGTNVTAMQAGIDQWLSDTGLDARFYVRTVQQPAFEEIAKEVRKSKDVILLLGFWEDQGGTWKRIGGHYVTVAGVNYPDQMLAFSDPFFDNAEAGGPGVVPIPHAAGHAPELHNDAQYVSHDFYTVLSGSLSPGGLLYIPDYPIQTLVEQFQGVNVPEEFEPDQGTYQSGAVHTEIEYAVVVSPKPDLVIVDKWVNWPDDCIIYYKIKNIGDTVAEISDTALKVNGIQVDTNHVPVILQPNKGYFTDSFSTYTWGYTLPSDTIEVGADIGGTVAEIDENNWITNTWMCGDVNEDKYVKMDDAWDVVQRAIQGSSYPLNCEWAGDVNGNGVIKMDDAWDVVQRAIQGSSYSLNCKCQSP